jgi:hypothetical protein
VTFPAAVEFWRPYILKNVGLPAGGMDFWLAWMAKESGGNPCSYTSLRESGLFQLMPPENTAQGGTSEAALRPACSGQTVTRSFTEAEVREQMVSFNRYLQYLITKARAKAAAGGLRWSESSPDFGRLVKWEHVAPGKTAPWIAAASIGLGRPPANWDELARFSGSVAIPANWVANATEVGGYWRGGSATVMVAALVGGAGLLYYLYQRRSR